MLCGEEWVCLEGRTVNQEQSYRKVSVVFSYMHFGIFWAWTDKSVWHISPKFPTPKYFS
jgi:hypothetical protein